MDGWMELPVRQVPSLILKPRDGFLKHKVTQLLTPGSIHLAGGTLGGRESGQG